MLCFMKQIGTARTDRPRSVGLCGCCTPYVQAHNPDMASNVRGRWAAAVRAGFRAFAELGPGTSIEGTASVEAWAADSGLHGGVLMSWCQARGTPRRPAPTLADSAVTALPSSVGRSSRDYVEFLRLEDVNTYALPSVKLIQRLILKSERV